MKSLFSHVAVVAVVVCALASARVATAAVGDPQIRTSHPWYPGELACSTFPRLFAEQARIYERVVGRAPTSDEHKAIASWLWRNTHHYHGEPGGEDLRGTGYGEGFVHDGSATRDYWTGLFSHGFALCGTTHAQWVGEMEQLLGHNRARCAGVAGHNSFEVFLRGGAYGDGRWALLDHDLSTVIFDDAGERLVSLSEVVAADRRIVRPDYRPEKQQGWLVSGLHPDDGAVFTKFATAEYLAGYAGPPPVVHLRRGETLRRYLRPGLNDGSTFVFWGRNYNIDGVAGPERTRTWVNQPEAMHGAKEDAGRAASRNGSRARYGNAVFTYQPNLRSRDYLEGVVRENDDEIVFEFESPYVIAAAPPSDDDWGIYQSGCKSGLVVSLARSALVSVSIDRGATWSTVQTIDRSLDLTDWVKGRRHYWLRFHTLRRNLDGLKIVTVCQANAAILPQLTDDGCEIEFQATARGMVSAGPEIPAAARQLVDGRFDSSRATLALATPRGERATAVYAAAHWRSSNPPSPEVRYDIELSRDGGESWRPLAGDWRITRYSDEPGDFWSQSFCWGAAGLELSDIPEARVRFQNDGGKSLARAEMHLAYTVAQQDDTSVTFDWTDDAGNHRASHIFASSEGSESRSWRLPTGKNVRTHWVEFRPAPKAAR